MPTDQQPFVSVIIPCKNNVQGLKKCVEALKHQSYPGKKTEIIVVDDCSDKAVTQSMLPNNAVLIRNEKCMGSAQSRNLAVQTASGDVYAFTDSDCIPDSHWITSAILRFESGCCDLIGGKIEMIVSDRKNASQISDAINNLRHDKSIPERGIAFTANLFIKRECMSALHSFEAFASGSDSEFTDRASQHGFRLCHCPESIVKHPARNFVDLMRKSVRIGGGKRCAFSLGAKGKAKAAASPHIKNLNPLRLYREVKACGFRIDPVLFLKLPLVQMAYVAGVGLSFLATTPRKLQD